jgi:hypothetical protein
MVNMPVSESRGASVTEPLLSPLGATVFVELNADDTPIGLLTVQKDLRVIKSSQAIDPFGKVFAPSKNAGVCTRAR